MSSRRSRARTGGDAEQAFLPPLLIRHLLLLLLLPRMQKEMAEAIVTTKSRMMALNQMEAEVPAKQVKRRLRLLS